MIRGTTAQFKFKLPYTMDQLEWIRIKFWQPHNPHRLLPITRTKEACSSVNGTEIYVSLTAEETARFSDKFKAIVQLRAQPIVELGGPVFGSKQHVVTVYPMLDDIIDEDTTSESPNVTEEGWVILDGENVG